MLQFDADDGTTMSQLSVKLRSSKVLSIELRMVHPSIVKWMLCSYSSSSRVEWILHKCAVEPPEFQGLARRVGIHRIAFLRHGNTAPAENGVDFDRVLTPLGREQSREAGWAFGARLFPIRRVLVSPAPRTVETAQLFLKEAASSAAASSSKPPSPARSDTRTTVSAHDLSLVQDLYDGTMQPEGSVLFRKIGYAPLKSYVDANDPADREVARRVLGEYSTDVAHEIFQTFLRMVPPDEKHVSASDGATLLVVGHAIYLPAAALGISRLCGCSNQEIILDTDTKEAQGYCIDLPQSSVTPLVR
jgi:Histidine phosphatase superfamily (branch 1)